MKRLLSYKKLLLISLFAGFAYNAVAQANMWNETTAKIWLTKKNWKKGLKPDVSPAVNAVVFAQQYHKNPKLWNKVFAFLRDSDLTKMKPGKYVIDGTDAYASISEGPSKTFEASKWESHRKYIDLHYVITGEETIGEAPVSEATVTNHYDEATDNANYEVKGKFYLATPDTFFLFFPGEAHRPNIKVPGYDVVKKLVIKIRFEN
ncbi:MAG TPA: YhcH/YjgK/YiaL family protein [Mucilaginibacter sp.]|nr:YhcH/YjgK/YiaL family protein [Mucilaginibacter sp.]